VAAMTTTRRFEAEDMYRFNNVNLDKLTETYHPGFYMSCLSQFSNCFYLTETPGGVIMGYVMGKVEETQDASPLHGHVTALTVSPEFRRLGLARKLMQMLEDASEHLYAAYFVDLFVRVSNEVAIGMYKRLGYQVHRRVLGYYSSGPAEDGFDMRKPLARDNLKSSAVPMERPVKPDEVGVELRKKKDAIQIV
jgi:N-terminal acetyltransferase B complex catalytic subunit